MVGSASSIIQHMSREELINCIGNNWNNNGDIRRGILQTIKDKTAPPTETEPPSTETETLNETNLLYKRWSDTEDQTLRKAIEVKGEKFDVISTKHFHNKRTEAQCAHRWNKNLKTTLKSQNEWTKEEDDIILQQVSAVGGVNNVKWKDISLMLPGRLSDHVKQRFLIKLDPAKKVGAWDESEMKILIDSQKELGNKWCEIAKRIPGRNELSVKNRWYNQILSDKRAVKRGIIRDSIISTDSKPSAKSSSITNKEEATASPPNKKQKRTWLCDVCQEETFDDYDKAVEHEKNCTKKKVQFNERGLNDVLFGRGGVANHNPGNIKFRELVDERKDEYKASKQGEKGSIARDIVKAWRELNPPGQFLKQDEITKLWSDVGDEMAVQKTSQTLRESKKKKKQKDEMKDDSNRLAEATI